MEKLKAAVNEGGVNFRVFLQIPHCLLYNNGVYSVWSVYLQSANPMRTRRGDFDVRHQIYIISVCIA